MSARSEHPFHMHDAIYAQPGALRLLTRGQGAVLTAAAGTLAGAGQVWVTGVGSSWHAALVGELLFAQAGRLGPRARAAHAFELAHSWPDLGDGAAVVAVSHRGMQRDVADVVARAKSKGGATVAVTGKGPVGPGAEHALGTVELEASGCHTVSYTTALAMLAALAAAVGHDDALGREVDALPDRLAFLLGQESWEDLAAKFGGRRRYWVVGAGPNTATALEAALKLNEAAWIPALGFNAEQFLHGPWAALEPDDALFLIAPPGPTPTRCAASRRRTAARARPGGREKRSGRLAAALRLALLAARLVDDARRHLLLTPLVAARALDRLQHLLVLTRPLATLDSPRWHLHLLRA